MKDADLLTGDRATSTLFLESARITGDAALVAKWIINDLPRALGGKELDEVPSLDAARFTELLALVRDNTLTASAAKGVLADMVKTGKPAGDLTASSGDAPAVDLGSAVDAVIAENPEKAAQYKAGKTGLLGFFVGQVMRSAPNADAGAVNKVVRERLG
jgi:Asp-tRNA(Asn)/Glu-tRNA(Gln) amidotransferase B subunit